MSELAVPSRVVEPLQAWASTELRDLPWRRTRDPWHILVSETMLQQTQVSRVIERYGQFIERFPQASICAAAPTSAVIELWAGLGYNRRAVNLWRAAQQVTTTYGGELPNDLNELLKLPGIGPYTARAILVFAFEQQVGVVDTNVGRLLARWSGQPLTAKQAQTMADGLVPEGDAWSWNQSLFDYASAVCTKRDPACAACSLSSACQWAGQGSDPAHASAGVSTAQSRFEGSERQVRGRIVNRLRAGPLEHSEVLELGRDTDTPADVERILNKLIGDGLAMRNGDRIELPS